MDVNDKWGPDKVDFVVRCREILETIPTRCLGNTLIYEDRHVRITDDHRGMEVAILPEAHPDGIENPCIMVNPGGEIIRFHGETSYIREHVDSLHASYFDDED